MSLAQWMSDFVKRLHHYEAGLASGFQLVWLGGLAFPSGWITATRQEAARRKGKPLEQLSLSLSLSPDSAPSDSFSVQGQLIQVYRSAAWCTLLTMAPGQA